jgi:hypothetical protein
MDIQSMVLIGFLCVVGVGALVLYLINLDKKRRIEVLKEWLLLAVIQAEKELGGGTGQVKLRFVNDLFLTKFTWLSKMISFEAFSLLVDEALIKMRDMLNSNTDLQEYVNK